EVHGQKQNDLVVSHVRQNSLPERILSDDESKFKLQGLNMAFLGSAQPSAWEELLLETTKYDPSDRIKLLQNAQAVIGPEADFSIMKKMAHYTERMQGLLMARTKTLEEFEDRSGGGGSGVQPMEVDEEEDHRVVGSRQQDQMHDDPKADYSGTSSVDATVAKKDHAAQTMITNGVRSESDIFGKVADEETSRVKEADTDPDRRLKKLEEKLQSVLALPEGFTQHLLQHDHFFVEIDGMEDANQRGNDKLELEEEQDSNRLYSTAHLADDLIWAVEITKSLQTAAASSNPGSLHFGAR
ncbi:unnamed protein product, partial [Amoebophrya sp. A25]